MSNVELNTPILIVPLSDRAVQALRETNSFQEEVLAALDRFQREAREQHPDTPREKAPSEIFSPQEKVEQELSDRLAGDGDLVSKVMNHLEKRLALKVEEIRAAEDFTFFVDRGKSMVPDDPEKKPSDIFEQLLGKKPSRSRDGELWLWDERAQRAASGRVVVCSCARGTKWSLTFRRDREYPKRESAKNYFNEFDHISDTLSSIIFPNSLEEHGLLVITGRTGSGKSRIARNLIQAYLKALNQDSGAHLVTFEDPIERLLGGDDIENARCTQRERPIDAFSLEKVLLDALRQTPKIVFVGETRRGEDWKSLLEFAGTGHLVITTAHAGSLVEAMGNILKETDSNTPATRSIVADRLLAVVHVKSAVEDSFKPHIPFLIPAIWHRTPLGVKALMAEGLSSLLPNTPSQLETFGNRVRHLPGSVGRYWFARELADLSKLQNRRDPIMTKALEWDLEGI